MPTKKSKRSHKNTAQLNARERTHALLSRMGRNCSVYAAHGHSELCQDVFVTVRAAVRQALRRDDRRDHGKS